MEMLTHREISGFTSIRHMAGLELRPLNVLIGANGAGKSNLIACFKLLPGLIILDEPELDLHPFALTIGAGLRPECVPRRLRRPSPASSPYTRSHGACRCRRPGGL